MGKNRAMPDRLRLPLSRWPMAALRHLLPSSCALCGAGCDGVVCPPCRAQYAGLPPASCTRCANPLRMVDELHADTICNTCQAYPPAFDETVAAVEYAAPLDQLVLQLKFGARLALAPWFAQLLRDAVQARGSRALPDLLCPVPLGQARLVERGFNQSLEIARPLAASLGVALHPRLAERTV